MSQLKCCVAKSINSSWVALKWVEIWLAFLQSALKSLRVLVITISLVLTVVLLQDGVWCGMNAAGCYFQCSTLYLIIHSSTLASNRKDAYFTFAALVPRCLCIYKVKFANSALKTTKQESPTKTNLCKASLKFLHSVWFRLLGFNGIQAAFKTTDFTQHIRRAHNNDVLHGVSST